MSSVESVAQTIRTDIEGLIESMSGEDSQSKTAYEVEGDLWWQVLLIGQQLLQLFFLTRDAADPQAKQIDRDGNTYPYVGQRQRRYVSLFGEVQVRRACYWLQGAGGLYPLDEALSLPARCFSDHLQQRLSQLSVVMPYDQSVGVIASWLRLDIGKRSAEQINRDHGEVMRAYYDAHTVPEADRADKLLVVSADGKGIPMTRADSPPPQARRSKGQAKTAKKEATVTAIYTIAPYRRSPNDIVQALLAQPANDERPSRPHPKHKRIFGTLAGQSTAFEHLQSQIKQRDNPQVSHRIALTDGDRGLKKRVRDDLPDFTLIVDIIHVTEYLWEAANALWGETHSRRVEWMADALSCVLDDDLDRLLHHLNFQASYVSSTKQQTLHKVTRYLRNNRAHMDYQTYLARGFPIATGVIEGACRHLVKDRFEQTGMRWSKDGAQHMLDLRAVWINDDWDAFQAFRREQAHHNRYGESASTLEKDVLAA